MLRPMPPGFPDDAYRRFSRGAAELLPALLSDEDLDDPYARRRQFDQAWLAVRHRYRACFDSSQDYMALFDNPPENWENGIRDEDYEYMVERALYVFFTSSISVMESLSYSLYFVGNAVSPLLFKDVDDTRKITLSTVRDAFINAFPTASISGELRRLMKDDEFKGLLRIRNVLAHRLSGARNIRTTGITHPDGRYEHEQREFWHLAGSDMERTYDRGLTQRRLGGLNELLSTLIPACVSFVESNVKKSFVR